MMRMLLMIEAASGEIIIDVDDLDGSANGSSNVFSFVQFGLTKTKCIQFSLVWPDSN